MMDNHVFILPNLDMFALGSYFIFNKQIGNVPHAIRCLCQFQNLGTLVRGWRERERERERENEIQRKTDT